MHTHRSRLKETREDSDLHESMGHFSRQKGALKWKGLKPHCGLPNVFGWLQHSVTHLPLHRWTLKHQMPYCTGRCWGWPFRQMSVKETATRWRCCTHEGLQFVAINSGWGDQHNGRHSVKRCHSHFEHKSLPLTQSNQPGSVKVSGCLFWFSWHPCSRRGLLRKEAPV